MDATSSLGAAAAAVLGPTAGARAPAPAADPGVRVLGAVMRRRRELLGLTQTEVARRLGYANPNMVSMLESGRTKVPVERAVEIAELHGLDPWWVLRRALVELKPGIGAHLPD